MQPEEFQSMRAIAVAAFDGDEHIGVLLDVLQSSWCWHDDLSFVAERAGEIVGQVLYTNAILDAPEQLESALVLSPVGIRPDLQRQGIGSRLITESLRSLANRPEALVFLEGSPAYYPRLGFVPAGPAGFDKPSDRIPDAAFQMIALNDRASQLSGRLVYPDAFWRTDSVGLRDGGELTFGRGRASRVIWPPIRRSSDDDGRWQHRHWQNRHE